MLILTTCLHPRKGAFELLNCLVVFAGEIIQRLVGDISVAKLGDREANSGAEAQSRDKTAWNTLYSDPSPQ